MPQLKQVNSLEEIANRVLLNSIIGSCKKLIVSETSTLIDLRECVDAIRDTIFKSDILTPDRSMSAEKYSLTFSSSRLSADFCARLMSGCVPLVRDEFDGIALLEMIMDIDIIGLRLTGPMVRFLKPYDAARLRRLKELDLSHARSSDDGYEGPPMRLEYFCLGYLTSLTRPTQCTNYDLEIIGRNCPKLQLLDIHDSANVTDDGLGHLRPCSNLRVLKVDRCPGVSHVGLSYVLSVLELEEFSYGFDAWPRWSSVDRCYRVKAQPPEFDMLSGLASSTMQYPRLTRFVHQNSRHAIMPNRIAPSLPNLTHLKILCVEGQNLSSVKYLTKLRELSVNFSSRYVGISIPQMRQTWVSLMEALNVIGAHLSHLALCSWPQSLTPRTSWVQDDTNFLYERCPNLEYLEFGEAFSLNSVPPFRELKELVFRPSTNSRIPENRLEFGNMLNLEILCFLSTHVKATVFESMMWDNVKFPKLRLVKTNSLSISFEDLARIQKIAKHHNLDFIIHKKHIKEPVRYQEYVPE